MFTCYLYEDIYHISEHTHGYTFQNIRISGRTATVLPLPRSDTSCIQLQIIIISIQECRTMWHLKISSSLAFQQEEHGQITTLQEIHVHSRQWRVPLILLQEHLQKPSLWKNSNPTILTEEYPVLDCKEDTGDTNWKSPSLLYEKAYNWHLLYNYPLTRSSNRSLSEYCFLKLDLPHRPPHAGVDKESWGTISNNYQG